ncbi:28857_t:CDS:2 [Gigaspora margarita]|uniref:28857_t:CDS:1 n=1 Tax=Gigaspora margarita TaxID=4874 RepID=A0ABN7VH51_GIGMA|nr:28857_t:CDS:2 [Gigaspora margarita]
MAPNRYNLDKTLTNVLVLWVLLLLCNFTFSESKILYSSSRNDLSDYKHFSVSSSYDGSFIINVMDDKNQIKAIHALLQNGTTIYIDLNFLNKDIKRMFPLNRKHYLLLYNNDNNQSTGIVLDWNKKVVKDNIFVANNSVENSKIAAVSDVRLSSFIISSQDVETVNWIVCNLPHDESTIVDYLAYDTFVLTDNSSLRFIFPTTDGIYGFITTELSYEINSILNAPVPIVSIYYMFLTPLNRQISKKFLLHYARNVSEISYISCSSSYSEIGNVCLITELVEKFQNNSLFITYQVDFLSSGSIVEVHALYFQFMYTNYSVRYDTQPLFYGGAVITSWSIKDNIIKKIDISDTNSTEPKAINVNDQGYPVAPPPPPALFINLTTRIISPNGSEIGWDFGNSQSNLTVTNAQFYVMKNNTYILYVVYGSNNGSNVWDIFATDLPKFKEDFGYENPNIISTYPIINDTLLPYITSIKIEFSNSISKSLNNITIYQTDIITKQFKPRKVFSGNSIYCEILNITLNCSVSSRIFNQWNSSYMITMDDKFVKFVSTNEPIYGIEENKWIFKTASHKATGVVRLTQDGTRKYDSLSPSDKTEFLNNFQQEFIISIPINPERLQLTNRIQYDPIVSSQYLLQIEILPTKDLYQDSVSQIIQTITELIKDETTIIYMNNYTKYLDSSYGLTININLWNELKWKLLGLLIGCIILLAIALWARSKYPGGQSFTICQIAFIFVDLILDIFFIAKNGKDVPWLYFPRLKF